MDITPKQFSLLLGELKKIREHLDQLCRTIDDGREEQRERDRNQSAPSVVVKSELQVPEATERDHGRRDDRAHGQQVWITVGTWLMFFATLGAFIAASAYAHYAKVTYREIAAQTPKIAASADAAEKSLKEAHRNFVAEQRPYVVVEEDYILHSLAGYKRISQPTVGEGFSVELHFRNGGKTLALRAIFQCHVVSDIEKIKPEPLERNQGEGEPIPQGGSVTRWAVYEAPYETGPVFAFGRVTYYDFAGISIARPT